MKIQAAVAWEAGAELSIEEFDLDDPRDDEILVRVEAVGVCHTDDNARLGRLPVVGDTVTVNGGVFRVERMDGRRIDRNIEPDIAPAQTALPRSRALRHHSDTAPMPSFGVIYQEARGHACRNS